MRSMWMLIALLRMDMKHKRGQSMRIGSGYAIILPLSLSASPRRRARGGTGVVVAGTICQFWYDVQVR